MSKTQQPTQSKMQILDPIGVACKLILLQFSEIGTRLRIKDYVLELIPPDYGESLIWRRWNGDSREDMCLLFASIVRFVELYLVNMQKSGETFPDDDNQQDFDQDCNKTVDSLSTDDCSACLKKMANYMISGIPHLEEVYGLTCAGLTLQYYINLLSDGIDGRYSKKRLPSYAQDITNQNLFQPEKLKGIWKSEDIRRITELFDNCFSTKDSNKIMLNGYITSIKSILNAKDIEFRSIIGGAF